MSQSKHITTLNMYWNIILMIVFYIIIPVDFWSLEILPIELWVMLGVSYGLTIGFGMMLKESYTAFLGAFLLLSLVALLTSRFAPNVASMFHLATNLEVSATTYISLFMMSLCSFIMWIVIKNLSSGKLTDWIIKQ